MAQQTIGLGTAPNDGTGDALRTAGGKINDNFTELYGLQRPISSFSAHKNSTSQTGIVGDNVVVTPVTFGTTEFNVGSHFASSAWTPPAGRGLISAQIYITGTFAATRVQVISIFKNGSVLKEGFMYVPRADNAVLSITSIVQSSGTDVFDIRMRGQADSGTLTVNGDPKWSYFTGSMV